MSWTIDPIPPIGLGTRFDSEPDPFGYIGQFRLARWPKRAAGTAIDFAVAVIGPFLVASVVSRFTTTVVEQCNFGVCHQIPGQHPDYGMEAALVAVLIGLLNSVVVQGRTGRSLGKHLLGLQLAAAVRLPQRGPSLVYPGIERSLARLVLLLLLDASLLIGLLRPAWHARRQTFADSILGTVVLDDDVVLLRGEGPKA